MTSSSFPLTDPRRARVLRAYLQRLAPALAPGWSGIGEEQTFGHALLEIAARLGEETTSRLDQTARRDMISFYDILDILPTPPRAATGVVAFSLAEARTTSAFAPPRVQVAASVPSGDEVLFETREALTLSPGRLADVLAVDPGADRIERAPARVVSLEPPDRAELTYQVVTFAPTESETLQLTPTLGLAAGDLIRIGPLAHRVTAVDRDLLTLGDRLEAPAGPGDPVTKVEELASFDLRDLQQHVFYVGHQELLNLEQPSLISLVFDPPDMPRRLAEFDISYHLWGTIKGADEPKWHELTALGADGEAIRLFKPWEGPVDKTKVSDHESRWIRATLDSSLAGRGEVGTRTARLCIGVQSQEPANPAGHDDQDREGSETIAQAFHNGAPLSVSSRFLPFGPEPLRFDIFALAASEALSKKGAKVDLEVTMVDSSLATFDIAVGSEGPIRGYGVGQNGYPQALAFEQDSLRWQELGPPDSVDDGARLRLDHDAGISAFKVGSSGVLSDLVVARDRTGGFWSAVVTKATSVPEAFEEPKWEALPTPDGVPGPLAAGFTVVPTPEGFSSGAVVFQPSGEKLLALVLTEDAGGRLGNWVPVDLTNGPVLGQGCQLVAVQGPSWPALTPAPEQHLVAIDSRSGVWLGQLTAADSQSVAVSWQVVVEGQDRDPDDQGNLGQGGGPSTEHLASADVRPAATEFVDSEGRPGLWVAWSLASGGGLHAYRELEGQPDQHLMAPATFSAPVKSGTALHANPGVLGVAGDRPITAGIGIDASADMVFTWCEDHEVRTAPPIDNLTTRQAYLVDLGDADPGGLQLVVAGQGEQLVFGSVVPTVPVETEFHDALTLPGGGQPAHYVDVVDNAGVARVIGLSAALVENEDGRIYLLTPDDPADRIQDGEAYQFLRADTADQRQGQLGVDRRKLTLESGDSETGPGDVLEIYDQPYRVVTVTDETPTPDPEPGDDDDPGTDTDGNGDGGDQGDGNGDVGDLTGGNGDDGDGTNGDVEPVPVLVAQLDRPVPPQTGPDSGIYIPALALPGEQSGGSVQPDDIGTVLKLQGQGNRPTVANLGFVDGFQPPTQQAIFLLKRFGVLTVRVTQPWAQPPPATGISYVLGDRAVSGWAVRVLERGYQNPELSWEFFDGEGWRRLEQGFVDGTNNFSTSGTITFTVSPDLAITEIGGKEDYWIRARLIGGDYGRAEYVIVTTPNGLTSTQTVTVDTSKLRPPEIAAIEARFAVNKPAPPELLLIDNNLAVLDQTQAAAAEGSSFELFQGSLAIDHRVGGRAIYLRFTALIDREPLVLYADVVDQAGDGEAQAELLTAEGWRRATTKDETASLRRRGKIVVSAGAAPRRAALFGQEGYWIRLRPKADQDARGWAPVVRGLYQNAVEVGQAKTIEQEILGTSLGQPDLVVELGETPVLPETVEIRVRERLSEDEAEAVEAAHRQQRLLAGLDPTAVPAIEAAFEPAPGSWVLWQRVDSFIGRDGDARVYTLDPATGTVTFGDGRRGKIPPAGRDALRAFTYQQGGGASGNIGAWSEMALKSALEAVETVILPVDTAGGFETPSIETSFATAPDRLRHAQQAMTPGDMETLAVDSSSQVVQARCFPARRANQPIEIVIVTRDGTRCPVPTSAQRDAVRSHLRDHGWGGLIDRSIDVIAPTYRHWSVSVRLRAKAGRLAEVETAATELLADFLHPTDGGPAGSGWPLGRRPWASDILRRLSEVDGIDRVEAVELEPEQGSEDDPFPASGLICIEEQAIDVVVVPVEQS